MKHKIMAIALASSLAGFGTAALADDSDDDYERPNGGKVVLCHKNQKSISVGAPGLAAHLAHGDTQGYCEFDMEPEDPDDYEDGESVVVMMHCEPEDGSFLVTAFSSSNLFTVQPLSDIGVGYDCADALAAFLDAGLALRSVSGDTTYLLLGENDDD